MKLRNKLDVVSRITASLWSRKPTGLFGGSLRSRITSNNTSRVTDKWNRSDTAYTDGGFKSYWELLEDVQKYQAFMMANGRDIIEYLASFFPSGKKLANLDGLVIGCNYGEYAPANSISRTGAFRKLLVIDIAQGLLDRQKKLTGGLGMNEVIQYKRMDLNMDRINEKDRYDLILALGTIHHIERLEGLFLEINRALRQDGIFCMREYVGPSRLQFTDKQIGLCNRILNALPDHLKKRTGGEAKSEVLRPSMADILAEDPSEAVRSQDIMGVARNSLEVLACNWTGGTLLHPLLDRIAGNFEKGDAERGVLKMIILLEQILVEQDQIPSDYVFLVAGKKRGKEEEARLHGN